MSKNYSNKDKYWEHDEIENNYKLHFIRFYEDEIIAIMFPDEPDEDDVMLWADYMLENVERDDPEPLTAETIEEAKAEVEERIVDLVQEQVEYLQSWIHKFKSTDDEDGQDYTIEERIDGLIRAYQRNIDDNCKYIENTGNNVIDLRNENSYFEQFIESLKYAKTGEINE